MAGVGLFLCMVDTTSNFVATVCSTYVGWGAYSTVRKSMYKV